MTVSMWIATTAWIALVLGYTRRKHKRQHIPLMLFGIFLDLALVLYLQWTRSAIQTALEFSLSIFEQMHIAFSTTALVLYFPTVYLGVRLLKGLSNDKIRKTHRIVASSALIFRTLGFSSCSPCGKPPFRDREISYSRKEGNTI
jgi:hypothetical protein